MSGNEVNSLITEKNLLVSPGEDEPENLELTISRADALMEEDKFEEALDLWEKILEFEFDFVMSCAGYAIAFMAVGKIHAALFVLEEIVKIQSNCIQSICGYANTLTKLDRAEESLPFAENVLGLEFDNVTAIICYGNALVKLRKVEDSLPWFEKATQLEPNNVKAITKYASALRKSGKIEKSLPLLEKAVQLEPNNAKAISSYASALIKLERVEDSLPWWEKSLQLEPDNVLTIRSYANALTKLKRVEDSLPWWEKSLQLEPDNVLTIRSYANALTKLKRVEDSLPWWEKSLQLEPDNVLTIRSYANALTKLKRVEDSLPWWEKSLQLEPDNVLTIRSYANALTKLKRVEDSLPWWEKSLQLEPDNVLTIGSYASALTKLERVEDSLPWWEKSLQLEPDNVLTIGSYANTLIKLDKVENSLPWWEKSLQLKPDDVITIRSYANALIKLERVEDSLPWWEKSLQLEPDDIITIRSYAHALIKLERVEDSLPWWEKFLQLEPDNVITIRGYANALIKAGKNALMKSGKFEESCQFFQKLLELKDDNYVRYKYAIALEELGKYQQAIKQLEGISLIDLLPYHADVIRLTLGRLYYSIKQPDKGYQYFQEAIDNSDDREKTLLYSARSILANNPYNQTAVEMLDEIAQDSPRYAYALKMLTLNLDSEKYFDNFDSKTKLKDMQMLHKSMYHKIGNDIGILKSIAYRILRSYRDENCTVDKIIEELENLVEEISKRREIQQGEIDEIPEDNYREILSVISSTAHDISDFVNNELALIESKTRRAMRKFDSGSQNYSQFEKLLIQLELTQAALNDLKAINEGITIRYNHFPVKKIFQKWEDNNKIENAEIKLEIINGDSEFSGDEEKIKSALNEMVENSLKHNSYQQNLIIKMKSQDVINPEGVRGLTMPGEKKYLLIEFSDNGKGIPEDKKQWVFQPLTTTSEKGQGSGLGLYIIRRTLIKMDGHIRETGVNGVRFEMYIPYGDN